jgi:hypothetical protein
MSTKTLVAAIKQTRRYQYEAIIMEQARWKRKQTIATNKLEAVRVKLEKFTNECVGIIEEKRLL